MLERLTSEDVVEELTVGETGDTIDFCFSDLLSISDASSLRYVYRTERHQDSCDPLFP